MNTTCRLGDLRNKEVISMKDGARIGFVCDAELDTHSAELLSVVVYGKLRLFGLLGRERDLVVPWKDIVVIGEDTVLVNCPDREPEKKQSALDRFFDKISF